MEILAGIDLSCRKLGSEFSSEDEEEEEEEEKKNPCYVKKYVHRCYSSLLNGVLRFQQYLSHITGIARSYIQVFHWYQGHVTKYFCRMSLVMYLVYSSTQMALWPECQARLGL